MPILPRLHLFELEDLPWFPALIRDYSTDFLHFAQTRFPIYQPLLPLLSDALQRSSAPGIIDLCSGGGGPILSLSESFRASGSPIRVTLTDKFPNLAAFQHLSALHPSSIHFIPSPVDAAAVPRSLPGLRTLFNAFHHFDPAQARAVLADAVAANQPIAIFEIPERTLPRLLTFMLTPLFVALSTPFIRPFRWSRLGLTYLLPLVPFTNWWDGIISHLRAYTVPELLSLTRGLDTFHWTAGRVPAPAFSHITYLIGVPIPR